MPSLLTRYLRKLRSVSIRNLAWPERAEKGELPTTCLQVLAKSAAESEPRVYFTSAAAPSTLNPTWLLLDLGCIDLPIDLQECLILRVICCQVNPVHKRPRTDRPGVQRQDGELDGTVLFEYQLDVRELWCLPPPLKLAAVYLPHNALVMATGETGEGLVVTEDLLEALLSSGNQLAECKLLDTKTLDELEEEHPNYFLAAVMDDEAKDKESRERALEALMSRAQEGDHRGIEEVEDDELQRLLELVAVEEALLEHDEGSLAAQMQALEDNTEEVQMLMDRAAQLKDDARGAETEIYREKELLLQKRFMLESRQIKLLGELQSIYPIERLENQEYAIRGLELPMDLGNTMRDDEHISSALGYACHLVLMLSKYLQVPLRYSLDFRASRSQVKDAALDQAVFPLYRKGVERERFDVAVGLLKKDIHQLLFARSTRRTNVSMDTNMLQCLQDLFKYELCPKVV